MYIISREEYNDLKNNDKGGDVANIRDLSGGSQVNNIEVSHGGTIVIDPAGETSSDKNIPTIVSSDQKSFGKIKRGRGRKSKFPRDDRPYDESAESGQASSKDDRYYRQKKRGRGTGKKWRRDDNERRGDASQGRLRPTRHGTTEKRPGKQTKIGYGIKYDNKKSMKEHIRNRLNELRGKKDEAVTSAVEKMEVDPYVKGNWKEVVAEKAVERRQQQQQAQDTSEPMELDSFRSSASSMDVDRPSVGKPKKERFSVPERISIKRGDRVERVEKDKKSRTDNESLGSTVVRMEYDRPAPVAPPPKKTANISSKTLSTIPERRGVKRVTPYMQDDEQRRHVDRRRKRVRIYAKRGRADDDDDDADEKETKRARPSDSPPPSPQLQYEDVRQLWGERDEAVPPSPSPSPPRRRPPSPPINYAGVKRIWRDRLDESEDSEEETGIPYKSRALTTNRVQLEDDDDDDDEPEPDAE